jgi:hypothetical protein
MLCWSHESAIVYTHSIPLSAPPTQWRCELVLLPEFDQPSALQHPQHFFTSMKHVSL